MQYWFWNGYLRTELKKWNRMKIINTVISLNLRTSCFSVDKVFDAMKGGSSYNKNSFKAALKKKTQLTSSNYYGLHKLLRQITVAPHADLPILKNLPSPRKWKSEKIPVLVLTFKQLKIIRFEIDSGLRYRVKTRRNLFLNSKYVKKLYRHNSILSGGSLFN